MRYLRGFAALGIFAVFFGSTGLAYERLDVLLTRPGERVLLSPIRDVVFEPANFGSLEDKVEGLDLRILYHPSVNYWAERFSNGRLKHSFEQALRKLWIYEGAMRPLFRKAGIPEELILICVVESHGRILSVSPQGAAGLWQMMPSTAKKLGLRVDEIVDERYDPVKSTWAVAGYLRKLQEKFKRWDLVLAAYNYGEDGVEDRIRRYGTRDFFRLAELKRFPLATRLYVPKVLAAIRVGRSRLYGSYKGRLAVRAVEVVMVARPISLAGVSEATGVPLSVLIRLNPAIKNPYAKLPGGFLLHLPLSSGKETVSALKDGKVL